MHRRRRLEIPPLMIIGSLVILVPIFVFMTLEDLERQKSQTTRLLLEKGEAIIRAVEAGVRTGTGFNWSAFALQKLLVEIAHQPGIDYIIITDTEGTIVADSDPGRIGEVYDTGLTLAQIALTGTIQWRRVPNVEGADTFEVYRGFGAAHRGARGGFVIFVGQDLGPLLADRKSQERKTIWTAIILLTLGVSGIFSLFVVQRLRTTRSSLYRTRILAEHLMENMPAGLIAIDGAGEVTACNAAAESLLDVRASSLIGRPLGEEVPPTWREMIGDVKGGKETMVREMVYQRPDGGTVILDVTASRLEGAESEGILLLIRDVTEIRTLRNEIDRHRRLAALGDLAAGVAHEIRNPLSSIKGFAVYFRERYGNDTEDGRIASIMIEEVERLNRVITNLLDLAKPLKPHFMTIPIGEVINHTLELITDLARQRAISIVTDLAEACNGPGDRDQLGQVLLNLFLNALEAMEEGGILTVACRRRGAYLLIRVSDTGPGIPPQDWERIFDPYFTTKAGGTGLGLAVAARIVEAHGGEIKVESPPGQGATFIVSLPVTEEGHKVGKEETYEP